MKEIKIGVSSIYRISNYGSTLQAAALQYAVRGLGYSCRHIRYMRNCVSSYGGLLKAVAHMVCDPIRE